MDDICQVEDLISCCGGVGLEDVKERYVRLAAGFHAAFGHSPQIFARSPGVCTMSHYCSKKIEA